MFVYRFLFIICTVFRCINGGDFRAQQCENEFFIAAPGSAEEAGHNWIPFEHTDNEFKCKLACYNRNTKARLSIDLLTFFLLFSDIFQNYLFLGISEHC